MLKTLRITSFVCIAAAAVGVLFVLVFGLKKDAKIESLLTESSIIEKLRKTSQSNGQKRDTESPLISEARAFALRIDPPPPPPPPPPPKPIEPKSVQTATDVVGNNRAFSGKFDLLGTVRYTDYPEKSLALLDVVPEGQKWFRQGETVGRLTIHEIKEGSIVLYSNGKRESELFVPPPPMLMPSLLKSDAASGVAPAGASSWSSGRDISTENANAATIPEVLPQPQPNAPTAPSGTRTPRGTVPIRRTQPVPTVTTAPPVAPEPEPTPQERKVSIDESITGIQQIMNETREGLSDAERQEENKAWVDLLKVLEEEKKSLENTDGANAPPAENKSEP